MRSRKRLTYVLKLIVTTALIAIIVWYVQLDEFLEAVRGMNWGYVLAAWVLIFLGVAVSAFKWQRLLMVHGVRFGYGRLLRWYLVGSFLGSFLPSTIGGDSFRIFKTMSNPRSKASAVLAVFVERVSGLLAMVILGYIAAISVYMRDQHALGYGFATLGTIGLISGMVVLAAVLYAKLGRRLLAMKFLPGAIKSFINHAGEYKSQPGQIAVTMLLSFLFHVIRFSGFWLILLGFGVEMRVDQIALVSTITALIALIPISLNGWGLQEGSILFLLQQFGVPSAAALALSLIVRVNVTSYALIGGVIYFFDKGEDETTSSLDDAAEKAKAESQVALRQPSATAPLRSGTEK